MCPPLYVWRDELTGEEVEVMRSFDDSGVPPDPEEGKERKWKKIIKPVRLTKGENWGPGKGYY